MQVLPTLVLGCLLLPSAPPPPPSRASGTPSTATKWRSTTWPAPSPWSRAPGRSSVELTRGGADAAKLRGGAGGAGRPGDAAGASTPPRPIVYAGLERGSSTTLRVREDGTFGDGHGWHHDDDDEYERIAGRKVQDLRRRPRPPGPCRPQGADAGRAPGQPLSRRGQGLHRQRERRADGGRPLRADDRHRDQGHARARRRLGTGQGHRRRGQLDVDTGSGSVEVLGVQRRRALHRYRLGRGDRQSSSQAERDSDRHRLRRHRADGGQRRPCWRWRRAAAASAPTCAVRCASWRWRRDRATSRCGRRRRWRRRSRSRRRAGGSRPTSRLQVTRHSRDHVVGQIGDGTGRVAIETGSGDVRLLKSPN